MKQLLPLLALLLLPSIVQAVQISDMLLGADNTPATGILYISWPSFISAANQPIGSGNLTVRIQNGVLVLNLAPTVGAAQVSGSSAIPLYTVRFISTSGNGASFTENWNVPVSNTPVTLLQIVCSSTVACSGTTGSSSGTSSVAGVASISVNGGAAQTGAVALTIPTLVSQLTDDSAFQTSSQVAAQIAAAIGSNMSASSGYADGEVPSGPINGANLLFNLVHAPSPTLSLQLAKNGMMMQQGGDYTLSGATVSFISAAVPTAGDSLQAWYRFNNVTGGSGFTYADAEIPQGGITGSNATFILAHSPIGFSLALYRNGLVQRVGLDFTLSGSTITFLTGALPQTGDTLQAWYRY